MANISEARDDGRYLKRKISPEHFERGGPVSGDAEPILRVNCWRKASSHGAWRAASGAKPTARIVICGSRKDIRIDRAPDDLMFRWMVTVDGRKRGAISLVAVLRQVREALDPGYAANRVRVAVAPLVPSP